MVTCKSPVAVIRAEYELGHTLLKQQSDALVNLPDLTVKPRPKERGPQAAGEGNAKQGKEKAGDGDDAEAAKRGVKSLVSGLVSEDDFRCLW